MDDDTLAPFVDALASALIIMLLVSIFFLVQSSTAIAESIKVAAISDESDQQIPEFSPIIYRDVVEYSLDDNLLHYVVNFKLDSIHKKLISEKLMGVNTLLITIRSDDDKKKSVVNILNFIESMGISENINVRTKIIPAGSILSTLSWELID